LRPSDCGTASDLLSYTDAEVARAIDDEYDSLLAEIGNVTPLKTKSAKGIDYSGKSKPFRGGTMISRAQNWARRGERPGPSVSLQSFLIRGSFGVLYETYKDG
jgi:hypothetical protein